MVHRNYFSSNYTEARKRFRVATEHAGGSIHTYAAGCKGPDGDPVTTDVAVIGDPDAPNILLCNSATHGVEGFCGSGIFTGILRNGETDSLPTNVKLVLIHALNCYGFAWLRRVTEENVDLNRNFVDHKKSHPKNTEYPKLHPILLPDLWNEKTIANCRRRLEAYASKTSLYKLQSALTGGQYDYPDGIFYGGREPTKAHRRFLQIVDDHVGSPQHVLFLDWHTGLGEYGNGQLLGMTRPGSPHGDRVYKWFGHGLETPAEGQAVSAPLTGTIGSGLRRRYANTDTEITSLTVEFGTYPVREVLMPLIADNWLHVNGKPNSALGREIKAQIKKALYPDEEDWRELVWVRGRQIIRRGITGLGNL
ncbi:MAG: M14 family metallopeptidase [Pseudomonadota bacterium]|nr:M14 family metallopeptidase [Pseudomonadota bacterium]